MSKEQFRDILTYSRELGLEPIPLLQTVGHGEYVMLHEKYHKFRENPERHDCYCTTNPEVRDFLRGWVEEYLDLFGEIRYFHLGGDEAYEFATCPQCEAYAEEKGRNQLYFDHISDIASPLLKSGVRPGIWGDMVLRHPDAMDVISKDFVLWDWNYGGSDLGAEEVLVWGSGFIGRERITDEMRKDFPQIENADGSLNPFYTCDFLSKLGYDVITCSSSRSAGDSNYCGIHKRHAENIVGSARKAAQYGLLGNCVTSWAIRLHCLETQEQWLSLAPLTIDHPDWSYEQILEENGKKVFGIDPSLFYSAIGNIGRPYTFNLSQHVGIQWNHLKDSLPAPEDYLQGFIEKLKTNEDWREAYWESRHDKLADADSAIKQGIKELNEFAGKACGRLDLINHWSLAGNMQLWHLEVARAVVAADEGQEINRSDVLEIINILRAVFEAHTALSQTPQSAAHNTGLMYDSLTEYLR
jgi:hypothetical protein